MSPKPEVSNLAPKELDLDLSTLAAKEHDLDAEMKSKKELYSDDFDGQEAGFYVFIFAIVVGMAWGLRKMGYTMDWVVIALMFCTLWETFVSTRKIQYGTRTLRLRNLKETGAELRGKDNNSNPFVDEENKVFLHIGDFIDYAVMKYVGKEVPIIVEQEYLHAKLHHSAQASEPLEDEEHQKWLEKNIPVFNLMRKLALRRGERIGTIFCGMLEASNINSLLLQCTLGFPAGNVMKYHLFEECEHAAVTVQTLKRKTYAIERFLALPFFVAMFSLSLIDMTKVVLNEPSLLLKPATWYQLPMHMLKVIFALVGILTSVLLFWVLPVPFPQSLHDMTFLYLKNKCQKAGIEWEVQKEVEVPLYL